MRLVIICYDIVYNVRLIRLWMVLCLAIRSMLWIVLLPRIIRVAVAAMSALRR